MKEVGWQLIKETGKYLVMIALATMVFFAMVISLARFFMPSLEQYEQQAADLIAEELGLKVTFGTFAGDWYRFGPALKVTDIVFRNDTDTVVAKIDTLYLSANIMASIAQRQLVPAYLNVIGLDVALEKNAQDGIDVVGWSTPDNDPEATRSLIIDALKKYNSITLRRSEVRFKPLDTKEIPIDVHRVVLKRSGHNHQLDAVLYLLDKPTQLDVQAQVEGDLAKPEDLIINSYVKLENIVFDDHFQHYLLGDYVLEGGDVDVTAWIDWQAGNLQYIQADINGQQLAVWSENQNAALETFNIKTEFLWETTDFDQWVLVGPSVLFSLNDDPLKSIVTHFKLMQTDEAYSFMAENIDLAEVASALLLSDVLTDEQRNLVSAAAPRGQLHQLNADWQDDTWQFGVQFEALAYQGWDGIPSATNLSGNLIATSSSGKLQLNSHDTLIDYTSVFPQPFSLSTLKGDIVWHYGGKFWEIHSEDLKLVNEDLTLQTRFAVTGGDSVDTQLDIHATTENVDTLQTYKYLPAGQLPEELTQWLNASIGPGEVEHLALTIKGPAKDLPFYDAGNGLFRLQIVMRDTQLTFDPAWPRLEHMHGELLLQGRTLQIALNQAQIFQTDLSGAYAEMALPDKGPYWLNVRGEVVTQAAHAVQFIQATPLKENMNGVMELLEIHAPLTLTLNLGVPIDSESATDTTKVNGVIQISEGTAVVKDTPLQFSGINGLIEFTENAASSSGVHAQLLDRPVLLTATPLKQTNQTLTKWQLDTRASIAEIAEHMPSPLWKYMQGESAVSASFNTGGDTTSRGVDLIVASDLQGVAINLPAPLTKARDTKAPLRYTTTFGKNNNTKVRLEYNKIIDALLGFSHDNTKSVLKGGRVQLGGALQNMDVPFGIFVNGSLPEFSVDSWESFIDGFEKNNPSDPKAKTATHDTYLKQLKMVDVSVGKLEAFHYPLTRAQIRLTQAENQWLLALLSREWSGNVKIPQQESKRPLNLDFSYCTYDSKKSTEKLGALDPRNIPSFMFTCKDFMYNNKSLGSITLNATAEDLGLRLDQVEMMRKIDSLKASGRWWYAQNGMQTRLAGMLKSNALDQTLLLADIKSSILNSKAQTDFVLTWPGEPMDFALAQLNGDLKLHLSGGVLVDVNPGFGRILSLLSVQSLQRRLRLDFSDVFKKGFSFDDMTATITIKNGLAHSDDLLLKAPAAEVKMQGDVNLATKQLNLSALVVAHISSTLPLAATIASGGNPIVGAVGVGVWAVDKIVKSTAGDIMGSTYRITGTWEKPIVNGK